MPYNGRLVVTCSRGDTLLAEVQRRSSTLRDCCFNKLSASSPICPHYFALSTLQVKYLSTISLHLHFPSRYRHSDHLPGIPGSTAAKVLRTSGVTQQIRRSVSEERHKLERGMRRTSSIKVDERNIQDVCPRHC